MNYENFEDTIMQGRRCKIVGWPHKIPFASPSTIGNLKDMRILHDGWMTGSIRWVRMTTSEVKEHAEDLAKRREAGETVGKKRKRRSSNKKRTAKSSKDSDKEAADDNESKPENDVQTKPKKAPKRARRTLTSQMPPKSKEIISESGSE
jgi:hypothetical protein